MTLVDIGLEVGPNYTFRGLTIGTKVDPEEVRQKVSVECVMNTLDQ